METLAQDLRTMVRTPLTEAHVAAMRRVGQEETLSAGRSFSTPAMCRTGSYTCWRGRSRRSTR
jgi:hypothetical protein